MIAQNQDIISFKLLTGKAIERNQRLQIKKQLNESLDRSGQQPYLTPLYYCFPSIELAKEFMLFGADPNQLSFLHCFFTLRPNFDYLKFVVNSSADGGLNLDIDECDVNDLTALGLVYNEQNYSQMQFLIDNGAQTDRPMFENGRTLIMDAALKGNKRMFEYLLKNGASKD